MTNNQLMTSTTTGVARNFDWGKGGGGGGGKKKVLYFFSSFWGDSMDDVTGMTCIYFLKFAFVINSLKYRNLAKSRNFRSLILKVKDEFLEICY